MTMSGHTCEAELNHKSSKKSSENDEEDISSSCNFVPEQEFEDCNNESAPDHYNSLITKAPYLPGTEIDLVPISEIPWFDPNLIEESMAFHRRRFTQIFLANTFALMFGFCVKPNSAVILRTGKLHDPELSFQRYLSTVQRIGKFLMFSFDAEKSYKAFDIVRRMHVLASKKHEHSWSKPISTNEPWKREICEAIRKDLGHIDTSSAPMDILGWDPVVPVSQFDMITTQFGFTGMMWLFPRVFGIEARESELKGKLHMWAVFGRLLGIRDEFNICIKPDPEVFDKIYRNILLASLKNMDETVITIQSAFMEAFNKRMPFMTYKAMLFFGLQEVEGYSGENLWKLMSFGDKLSLKFIQVWFWALRTSSIFAFFCHIFLGLWLQFQFWMHLKTSLWE